MALALSDHKNEVTGSKVILYKLIAAGARIDRTFTKIGADIVQIMALMGAIKEGE